LADAAKPVAEPVLAHLVKEKAALARCKTLMKILISGSTGFIGQHLVSFLRKKRHKVTHLTRHEAQKKDEISWDADLSKFEGFEAFIHLSGESIMGRWTKKKKQLIFSSRVDTTKKLHRIVKNLSKPPHVVVVASAIGFFGNRGDEILTEKKGRGKGFLADLCVAWEKAASLMRKKGTRVVSTRFGIVLGKDGGFLSRMVPLFKAHLGGRVGTGQQYISWIEIDDLVRILEMVLHTPEINSSINVVAPHPVTNEIFTQKLSKAVGRYQFVNMPAFMARLLFGELADEALLSSQRVIPQILEKNGYTFLYPALDKAFKAVI